MSTQLPTKLYAGRTIRVHSLNCVEIDLQLGFGVSVRKSILLEGVQPKTIPRRLASGAKHCLVVLLGGKRVIVHVDDHRKDGFLVGRVYLDEKVYGDPVGMLEPFGLAKTLLEVSTFYAWLADREYDIAQVKAVLNGNGRG